MKRTQGIFRTLFVVALAVVAACADETPDDAVAAPRAASATSPPAQAVPRRRATEAEATEAGGEDAVEPEDDAPARPARPMTVRVVKAGTGEPVSGASVVGEDDACVRHEATSGEDGIARFDPPIEGGYARIGVTARGMTRGHAFADAEAVGTGAEVKVELADGRTLDGIVIDDVTGRGVAGARVAVRDPIQSHREYASATTDPDGTFRIESMPAKGQATLIVEEPHHARTQCGVDPTSLGRLEVRMRPAGAIRGIVRNPDGVPVRGAVVVARTGPGPDQQPSVPDWTPAAATKPSGGSTAPESVVTGADGSYEIGGVALDRAWTAFASAEGFTSSERGTPLAVPAETHELVLDLALRRAAAIEVRATVPGGGPAAGARVRIDQSDVTAVFGRTDAQGVCVVSPRATGASILQVELAPHLPLVRHVDVVAGESTVLEIELGAGATLSGVVVDDLARAVENAAVVVSTHDSVGVRMTRTAADGTFRVDGVPRGDTTITVRPRGTDLMEKREKVSVPGEGVRVVLLRRSSASFRLRAPAGVTPTRIVWWIESAERRHNLSIQMDQWTAETMRIAVDPGKGTLHISADGVLAVKREIDVQPGEELALGDIELEALSARGATIRVSLRGAGGATANVEVGPAEQSTQRERLTRGADGKFVKQVAAGTWRVSVVRGDTTVVTQEVEVADGRDVSLEFDVP
jgi:hypothetical protein